jgi:uncharacterized protein (DUF849 family)
MPSADTCIISAALSGVAASKEQCPAIPYAPAEYAEEARRAREAGAAVVHLHARHADGTPSYGVAEYRAITDAIREVAPDLVINYSTGAVGIPREERVAHVRELVPDIAALNMGSMNYAKYSSRRKAFVYDHLFENRFETIAFFLEQLNAAGSRPECECFDTGHVVSSLPLADMGLLPAQVSYSMVMGVLGGAPARVDTLAHMASLVPPVGEVAGGTWQVVGVSRAQWELVTAACELGGNERVGLEDNFYLPSGEMAGSNGDLVEEAARIVEASGRRVATPAEARAILGLDHAPAAG